MPRIIAAGLGPGAWDQVTLEVKSLLDSALRFIDDTTPGLAPSAAAQPERPQESAA